MREAGRGPWAPEVLAEDARRLAEFQRTRKAVPWEEVKAWMQGWDTPKRASSTQAAQAVKLIISREAAADLDRLHAFLADKDGCGSARSPPLRQPFRMSVAAIRPRSAKRFIPRKQQESSGVSIPMRGGNDRIRWILGLFRLSCR
jgi:hypothetical protein